MWKKLKIPQPHVFRIVSLSRYSGVFDVLLSNKAKQFKLDKKYQMFRKLVFYHFTGSGVALGFDISIFSGHSKFVIPKAVASLCDGKVTSINWEDDENLHRSMVYSKAISFNSQKGKILYWEVDADLVPEAKAFIRRFNECRLTQKGNLIAHGREILLEHLRPTVFRTYKNGLQTGREYIFSIYDGYLERVKNYTPDKSNNFSNCTKVSYFFGVNRDGKAYISRKTETLDGDEYTYSLSKNRFVGQHRVNSLSQAKTFLDLPSSSQERLIPPVKTLKPVKIKNWAEYI